MRLLSRVLIILIAVMYGASAHAAVTVSVNGSNHTIPQTNEKGWGANVTAWIQAISANTLQPSGGTFTLTADTNFGANYGLLSNYYKSRSSNISSAGVLRLSNTDQIGFRNAANSGNLLMGVDASDRLTFNGSAFLPTAALTASRLLVSDASGVVSASSVTSTEAGRLSGVGSALCGISDACTLTNKTLTAPIFSTISNTGTLTLPTSTDTLVGKATTDTLTNKTFDADGTGNSISNIENADIKTGAAIDRTKIASGSNSHVIINDGTGVLSSEATLAIARGGTGQSTAQAAIDALVPTQTGNSGEFLTTDGTNVSWASPAGTALAIATKSATYTVTSSDDIILADTSAGGFTLTLPAAASNAGKVWTIIKTSSSNLLTIDGNSAETIDGDASIQLVSGEAKISLFSDGTNIRIKELSDPWRVEAIITGASPSLGTGAAAFFTNSIENSSLSLANSTVGSVLAAEIGCANGTAPSGATCSAVNESLAVAFTIPKSGMHRVCVTFGYDGSVNNGTLTGSFRLVETSTSATTTVAAGDVNVQYRVSSTSTETVGMPIRICDNFNFSTVAKKLVRLSYGQSASGTVSSSQIFMDGTNRNLTWEVFPL